MAPYLPRDGASGSPYSEGGALYALGLIHANHGQDIRGFLLECLRGTQNEVSSEPCCTHLTMPNPVQLLAAITAYCDFVSGTPTGVSTSFAQQHMLHASKSGTSQPCTSVLLFSSLDKPCGNDSGESHPGGE